jgi:hypothetical protein
MSFSKRNRIVTLSKLFLRETEKEERKETSQRSRIENLYSKRKFPLSVSPRREIEKLRCHSTIASWLSLANERYTCLANRLNNIVNSILYDRVWLKRRTQCHARDIVSHAESTISALLAGPSRAKVSKRRRRR